MNLKITKKIISILCAATMAVSSMGASVGAIKMYNGSALSSNQKADLNNAVNKLNKTLKSSTDIIDKSIDLTKSRVVKSRDELIKITTITPILEQIKTQMKKWDDFSIENINLVNETNYEINNLNLNKILEDLKDANKLDSVKKDDLNKTLEVIKGISIKLEKENQRLLSQENDNNKQKEKSDVALEKRISQINTSKELTNQEKIENIVKILESEKFNDYHRQINAILPVLNSLNITDENVNIEENKNLRNKLKKFLLQSAKEYIDETIKIYKENEITQDIATYIDAFKSDIAQSAVNNVITSTFYDKYTVAEHILDIVNTSLSLYEEELKNSIVDKDVVKAIDEFCLLKLVDKIEDEKCTFDYKKESEKTDIMLRNFVKRITKMETKLEKGVEVYEGRNGELINFQEAAKIWGDNNLESHYQGMQDIDHLENVLKKYKLLHALVESIREAVTERSSRDINVGGDMKGNEEDFKAAIKQARKAIKDYFKEHLTAIDKEYFVLIEN